MKSMKNIQPTYATKLGTGVFMGVSHEDLWDDVGKNIYSLGAPCYNCNKVCYELYQPLETIYELCKTCLIKYKTGKIILPDWRVDAENKKRK